MGPTKIFSRIYVTMKSQGFLWVVCFYCFTKMSLRVSETYLYCLDCICFIKEGRTCRKSLLLPIWWCTGFRMSWAARSRRLNSWKIEPGRWNVYTTEGRVWALSHWVWSLIKAIGHSDSLDPLYHSIMLPLSPFLVMGWCPDPSSS